MLENFGNIGGEERCNLKPFHRGTLFVSPLNLTFFVFFAILGAVFFHTEEVLAVTFTWDNTFDPNETVELGKSYSERTATLRYTSVGLENIDQSFTLNGTAIPLVTQGNGKWLGNNRPWPWNQQIQRHGKASDFGSIYNTTAYKCGAQFCVHFRLIPNSEKINTELKAGDTWLIPLAQPSVKKPTGKAIQVAALEWGVGFIRA